MRFRLPAIGCSFLLTAGCIISSQQAHSQHTAIEDASHEFAALTTGDWCRVELSGEQHGQRSTRIEHIGRVEDVSSASITLSSATTYQRTDSRRMNRIPYLNRLFKNTGVAKTEQTPLTVPRERIRRIERISDAEAETLSQPYERIGIDFN